MYETNGVRCDFCGVFLAAENHNCIASDETTTASRAGWDWYTGKRKTTFHACKACLRAYRAEFNRIIKEADEK